jgi:hypothetical protein
MIDALDDLAVVGAARSFTDALDDDDFEQLRSLLDPEVVFEPAPFHGRFGRTGPLVPSTR